MPGMNMGSGLPPLTWQVFFHTWHFPPGWTLALVMLAIGYLVMLRRVGWRSGGFVGLVRLGSFMLGLAVIAISVSGAIEPYSDVLFWDHMVQHLLLIMVAPALLVVGRPLDLLERATGGPGSSAVRRVLASPPAAALTHPLVAIALYAVIIVATHLTGFMNAMATHPWLHNGEHVLYIVGGYIFLLPMIGGEPIRWRLPPLARIGLLFVSMAPDTVVGIVLLQTDDQPFPAWARGRPSWAPDSIHDVNVGGGIMWVFGDGLMMLFLVGLILTYILDPSGNSTAGSWVENVRRQTLAANLDRAGAHADLSSSDPLDEDEAALAAYNAMLKSISDRENRQRF